MRYLDLFAGIGGFTLGIQQANEKLQGDLRLELPVQERRQAEPHEDLRQMPVREALSEMSRDTRRVGVIDKERHSILLGNGRAIPVCIGYSEIDKHAIATYQSHFPEHKNYGDITKINAEELPDFDFLCGGFPCQSFSIAGKRGGFSDTRGTLFFDIARILKAKQPRLLLLENVKGLLSHDEGRTFATIIATLDELGYDIQWQVLNSKNHGVPQNRERVFIIGHLRGTPRPEVFPILGESGTDCKIIGRATGINGHDYLKRIYSPSGASPTLPTGTGGNHEAKFQMEDMRVRRLTPIECERLQGFPDNWTIGSDTQRYKQCGNAVTVNVIKAIMSRILSTN